MKPSVCNRRSVHIVEVMDMTPGGEGGVGGTPHIKVTGVIVVPFIGLNSWFGATVIQLFSYSVILIYFLVIRPEKHADRNSLSDRIGTS